MKKSEIEELEKKIEKYNKIISNNPNKHQAWYVNAQTLSDLGRYDEAIKCCNEALKIEPESKRYFAERAKIYGLSNQPELALEDLRTVSTLPDQGDGFSNMMLSYILRDVQKLDSVKKKISELRSDTSINPLLLDAIDDLSSITGNLCFKVGVHEDRLGGHDDAIKELKEAQKASMALIEKIKNANRDEIESMHIEIEQQKISALFAETRIKSLEDRVSHLEEFQEKFPEDFMKFKERETGFQNYLNTKSDLEQKAIKGYVDGFITQCSVSYTSALVITSGQLKLDTSNIFVTVGSNLISFIPYVGDTISKAAKLANDQIKSIQMEAKADTLIKYSSNITAFEQNMLYAVQTSLLDSAKETEVINSAESKSGPWWNKVMSFGEKIVQKAKDIVKEDMLEKLSTPQYKLGTKDASDMLAKLLLSGEIFKTEETSSSQLDIIIKSIIQNNNDPIAANYFTVEYDNPAITLLSTTIGQEIFKASNKSLDEFINIGTNHVTENEFALDVLGE